MKSTIPAGEPFGQVDVRKPMQRDVVFISEFGCWYKLSAYSDEQLLFAAATFPHGLPEMNEGVVNWSPVEEVNADWFPKLEDYFGRDWVPFVKGY